MILECQSFKLQDQTWPWLHDGGSLIKLTSLRTAFHWNILLTTLVRLGLLLEVL